MNELKLNVDEDLKKQIVNGRILLDRFKVIDEDSRKTSEYSDPRHFPFYYHLGKYIFPKNVVEIGLDLGFSVGCFLKSCKSVENFFGFKEKDNEFYSSRIAEKNIKSNYKGKIITYVGSIIDENFEKITSKYNWDLIFLNEKMDYDNYLDVLEVLWNYMNLGCYMVFDYISVHKDSEKAFLNFCKIKNVNSIRFNTRYGIGILQK